MNIHPCGQDDVLDKQLHFGPQIFQDCGRHLDYNCFHHWMILNIFYRVHIGIDEAPAALQQDSVQFLVLKTIDNHSFKINLHLAIDTAPSCTFT